MRQFVPYTILEKTGVSDDTHILRLKAQEETVGTYTPGQFCLLQDPLFEKPDETHPFSFTSIPDKRDILEFCIKIAGDWTAVFAKRKQGDTVMVSQPLGKFVWDGSVKNAAFLVGGVGIAPVMSMLRSITEKEDVSSLTLLYGNRTPDTAAYRAELEQMTGSIHLKLIHIYSDLPESYKWSGYRGFITDDILQKELSFSPELTFFVVGPPVFIQKMQTLLSLRSIPNDKIRREIF